MGREICDVMLAVSRAFHRADYVPCILWGRLAKETALMHTGDVLSISGRLQSRVYTKLTEAGRQERTAYEVSALTARQIFPEE
jgi:single-stranded DNA-binding protein